MRKFKIFITYFILYEFVVLTILQIPRYCIYVFNGHFCNVSFRYFLMCMVVPITVGLILWWIPDISKHFCGECQCDQGADIKKNDNQKQIISKEDIEHLVATAAVAGIKKFISTHPKTTKTVNDILDVFMKPDNNKTKKLTK